MSEEQKQKFPSEVIDLPSEGKIYPKDSPLADGKLEIKYMTAKEEDILTSQNLIKKGVVIDRVLDSLILTPGVKVNDLILGDKNAVMVAARILAYGPEYECEFTNPVTGDPIKHTFNLADCPFTKVAKNTKGNEFKVELPISKVTVTYKILTGKEEKLILDDLNKIQKLGSAVVPALTTRLRYTITAVDGDTSRAVINKFVDNMLAKDSMFFRGVVKSNTPDIELKQEIEIEGESVKVDIPMTVTFFWPSS